jgi:predicted transcriptional regulator
MATLTITDEQMAQLSEFAQRRGQDTASALNQVLTEYLSWEQLDHQEAIEGIREGHADLKAGHTRPIQDVFHDLREKHDLSR